MAFLPKRLFEVIVRPKPPTVNARKRSLERAGGIEPPTFSLGS
jgi:hypothetical protein